MLSIVGVDDNLLGRVETFSMVAGEVGMTTGLALFIGPEFGDGEGMDIDFVESLFHGGVVDFVFGIGEMAGVGGWSSEHLRVRNGANVSEVVDSVGADEELLGLLVDHAIGGSATDTFAADDEVKVRGDFVEFVGGTEGFVGSVGNNPQFTGPGDHGTGPAFSFLVVHGQVGIDAREGGWLGMSARVKKGAGREEEEGMEWADHEDWLYLRTMTRSVNVIGLATEGGNENRRERRVVW